METRQRTRRAQEAAIEAPANEDPSDDSSEEPTEEPLEPPVAPEDDTDTEQPDQGDADSQQPSLGPEDSTQESLPSRQDDDSLGASTQPSDTEVQHLPIDDLVFLGPRCCRVSMTVNVGGVRVPSVCGRTIEDCGRAAHERRRNQGEVNPVGAYTRLEVPRGFRHHGQSGLVYYTQEEWQARNEEAASPRCS